jgi:hypothetical protein
MLQHVDFWHGGPCAQPPAQGEQPRVVHGEERPVRLQAHHLRVRLYHRQPQRRLPFNVALALPGNYLGAAQKIFWQTM